MNNTCALNENSTRLGGNGVFQFRRAERVDLPMMIKLLADDELGRQREDVGPPLNPHYERAFQAINEDTNQFLAVVEDEGDVVGCMQLSFIPGLSHVGLWRGQIESVRISSTHRGSGLGQRFFEWALQQFRDRDCGLVQLTTDKARPEAMRFYKSLGFVDSHQGMKLNLK